MKYSDIEHDLHKLAQEFGWGGAIREAINIGGNWVELTNSEFKNMMDELRTADDRVRNLVTGKDTGHDSLKKILESAKSKINRREYPSALADLVKFYDIIQDSAEELKKIPENFVNAHYSTLSKGMSPDELDRLVEFKQRYAAPKQQGIVKQAGILDTLHNILSSRGRTLRSWEKRFPKMAGKLKRTLSGLLRISVALNNYIIQSLKQMKEFRIKREVESYLEQKNKLLKKMDSYNNAFKQYYNAEVKSIIEKMEEVVIGVSSSALLPGEEVVTPAALAPVTPPAPSPPTQESFKPLTPAAPMEPSQPAGAVKDSSIQGAIKNVVDQINKFDPSAENSQSNAKQIAENLEKIIQQPEVREADPNLMDQVAGCIRQSEENYVAETFKQEINKVKGALESIPNKIQHPQQDVKPRVSSQKIKSEIGPKIKEIKDLFTNINPILQSVDNEILKNLKKDIYDRFIAIQYAYNSSIEQSDIAAGTYEKLASKTTHLLTSVKGFYTTLLEQIGTPPSTEKDKPDLGVVEEPDLTDTEAAKELEEDIDVEEVTAPPAAVEIVTPATVESVVPAAVEAVPTPPVGVESQSATEKQVGEVIERAEEAEKKRKEEEQKQIEKAEIKLNEDELNQIQNNLLSYLTSSEKLNLLQASSEDKLKVASALLLKANDRLQEEIKKLDPNKSLQLSLDKPVDNFNQLFKLREEYLSENYKNQLNKDFNTPFKTKNEQGGEIKKSFNDQVSELVDYLIEQSVKDFKGNKLLLDTQKADPADSKAIGAYKRKLKEHCRRAVRPIIDGMLNYQEDGKNKNIVSKIYYTNAEITNQILKIIDNKIKNTILPNEYNSEDFKKVLSEHLRTAFFGSANSVYHAVNGILHRQGQINVGKKIKIEENKLLPGDIEEQLDLEPENSPVSPVDPSVAPSETPSAAPTQEAAKSALRSSIDPNDIDDKDDLIGLPKFQSTKKPPTSEPKVTPPSGKGSVNLPSSPPLKPSMDINDLINDLRAISNVNTSSDKFINGYDAVMNKHRVDAEICFNIYKQYLMQQEGKDEKDAERGARRFAPAKK